MSAVSRAGESRIIRIWVGTIQVWVICSFSMVARILAGSKPWASTWVAAFITKASAMMPAPWVRGAATRPTSSGSSRWRSASQSTATNVRQPWESMAPFDRPVVPPV